MLIVLRMLLKGPKELLITTAESLPDTPHRTTGKKNKPMSLAEKRFRSEMALNNYQDTRGLGHLWMVLNMFTSGIGSSSRMLPSDSWPGNVNGARDVVDRAIRIISP